MAPRLSDSQEQGCAIAGHIMVFLQAGMDRVAQQKAHR
jgi:hypothetical protein